MAVDTKGILEKTQTLFNSIGRAAANTLYKNEFEYYMLGLELTDFEGNTIDYFAFPVMPSSITKNETTRLNVKKTYGGITVINSKSFTPSEVQIKGNFGRNFKIMVDVGQSTIFKAFKFSLKNGINDVSDIDESKLVQNPVQFDVAIKTGYGCIKILQSIINKAAGTDDRGKSFKLYLYNPALGESYLVVPTPNPLVFSQNDSQSNMIWQYVLNLIAIAPISGNTLQGNNSSNVNILSPDIVQKATSTFVSIIRPMIGI